MKRVLKMRTLNYKTRFIQLAGKLDEAGLVVERPHLPREVMRIEGNAVPADAGTGRELHEAEWLRRRRLDHFPHVHAELVADDRHLVDETDVHAAERVLEDLDELCRLRGGDRHERVDGRLIQCHRDLQTGGRDPPADPRRVSRI